MDDDLELTVWFDADCGLCRRVAAWVEAQPKYVPVHCRPAQQSAGSCPLNVKDLLRKVTVTASDGAIYRGPDAWITCLWALRDWRGIALRMAEPGWRPWAERLFAAITGLAAWTKRPLPSGP